ncbi:phosphotransferase family protein [Salinigranum rubrum]|uniref:phosphotransferase family protein n=1 Tax=Salinigranum rubrum TaxID=755307 RepID=UPI0013A595D0|nr:aminoglycoside phosphotransferase family protein [Salinigranum rubrum]
MEPPEAVVAALAHAFGSASDVRGVERLSGGCKDTYRVELGEETVVVAFPREPWYEESFALEPALMRLVHRETSLPVPRVLASDVFGARPYHVTEYVDAPDLRGRFAACPRATQAALLEAAGRVLAELHGGVRFESSGPLRREGGEVTVDPALTWPAFLSTLVERWLTELDESRFADLRGTFETALTPESFLSVAPDPVCLHFDYAPGNLLARGDAIVGVVDWGFAVSGHAEYDLFQFEKNFLLGEVRDPAVRDELRPHVYAGYRERGDLAPGWERRRAFYRVAYKLASMRSFHRWAGSGSQRGELVTRLRAELETDLERLDEYERGREPTGQD